MTITIPDFEDCPAWCNSIQVYFCQSRDPREAGKMGFAGIKVDRPVSPWVPTLGNQVFAKGDGITFLGTLVEMLSNGDYVVQIGERQSVFKEVKSFDPFKDAAKIGRPWEEI